MIEKAQDRLDILKKIEEFERKAWFSKDVEEDPPTIPLTPDQVDYTNKKFSNWLSMKFVNVFARRHINKLLKEKQLIMKETIGIENFIAIKDKGAILTCNHFNAFDNFAVYKAIEKYLHRKELYKVIREGNYTNFPGLYGWFFRHCNTMPLSQNLSTMRKFMKSVEILLKRNEKILIYPEQGMWWNYRKPRPMTVGAFKFAANNNVPILPMFITMEDSDLIGGDGFPVQIYTVHILEAIYPKAELSKRENAEYLTEKNYEVWKKVYEETYKIPLEYLTQEA